MILEAVAYAQGKLTRPPYELQIGSYTDKFGSPWGAGWMDWPAGLPGKVMTAQAYARAFELYKAGSSQKDWANNNRAAFELVTTVWKWRKDAGLNFMG